MPKTSLETRPFPSHARQDRAFRVRSPAKVLLLIPNIATFYRTRTWRNTTLDIVRIGVDETSWTSFSTPLPIFHTNRETPITLRNTVSGRPCRPLAPNKDSTPLGSLSFMAFFFSNLSLTGSRNLLPLRNRLPVLPRWLFWILLRSNGHRICLYPFRSITKGNGGTRDSHMEMGNGFVFFARLGSGAFSRLDYYSFSPAFAKTNFTTFSLFTKEA